MTEDERVRADIISSLAIALSTRGERFLLIYANVDRWGRAQPERANFNYAAEELACVLKYAFSAYARFEDGAPHGPSTICPSLIDALKVVPMALRVAAASKDRDIARKGNEDVAAFIYDALAQRNRFVRLTENAARAGWNWDKVFEMEYGPAHSSTTLPS